MATLAQHNQPGLHNLTKRQLVGTLAGLLLTLLMAALDQTIVGTAMPRIISQLNGFDRYPWVTTAYLLTSTIAVPIFAKLSDIYGRKWFFLAGTIVFVIASAFCGGAGQMPWIPGDGMMQLIIFRGIQGVGAGMIVGLLFTIIGDIFAPAERAKFQGLFAAVWGLASIFGPTLGGWITDEFSWRWTFWVNLPVGALAALSVLVEFPYFRPQGVRRQIDWLGVFTLSACLIPLLLALTWVSQYGWLSQRVMSLLILAGLMLVAFLLTEHRAAEPLLPLWLFRNPIIAAGNIIGKTGRYRTLAVVGAVLATIGMFLLAAMDGDTTRLAVVRNMIIAGLGIGIMQPIYTLVVQNVAPQAQMGAATASTQFFRSIGATVGVAVFGSVLLTM